MNNEVIITNIHENMRLDRFVKKHQPNFNQAFIESSLRKGSILVNFKKSKSNYRLQINDVINIPSDKITNIEFSKTTKIRFDPEILEELQKSIIFQDDDIAILNKPAGLATQGGTKVPHSIDSYLPKLFPKHGAKLVHRLDKDTSGVIMIALNDLAARELASIIKDRLIEKTYLCIVVGFVKKLEGQITLQLDNNYKVETSDDGKISVTKFKVLQRSTDATLLEMQPITGRKHQIRVTCLEMGHPILGDGKYGSSSAFIDNLSNKLHLHAYKLSIPDFMGKTNLNFTAALNKNFKKTLELLDFSIDDTEPLYKKAKKWAK